MKHTPWLLMLSLLVFGHTTFAQQTILLKSVMSPNTTYKTEKISVVDLLMTATGDSAAMAGFAARGMKSPTESQLHLDVHTTTKTMDKRPDSIIPLTVTSDTMIITTTSAEGKRILAHNPYAGATIHGTTVGNGTINLDSITGNLSDEENTNYRNMVSSTFRSLVFPEKELQIGEAFESEMPMLVPMFNVQVKMTVHSKSILKEIKDNQAILDIEQSITLDSDPTGIGYSVSGDGSGKGRLIYNIKNQFPESGYSNAHVQLITNKDGLRMTVECNGKITFKYMIE